jgi:hypothetical protein
MRKILYSSGNYRKVELTRGNRPEVIRISHEISLEFYKDFSGISPRLYHNYMTISEGGNIILLYFKVRQSTSKYMEVHRSTSKYNDVLKSTLKYDEVP